MIYRSLHGAKVKILVNALQAYEDTEVLEFAQCTAAECYLGVVRAIDLKNQNITVSQYTIDSYSDMVAALNVTKAQLSKVIPAKGGKMDYSIMQANRVQTVIDKVSTQALLYEDYTSTRPTGGEFLTGEDWDKDYIDFASTYTNVDGKLGKAFKRLGKYITTSTAVYYNDGKKEYYAFKEVPLML